MERMPWKRPYLGALDSTGRTEGVGSRVKEKQQSIHYHCKMRVGDTRSTFRKGKRKLKLAFETGCPQIYVTDRPNMPPKLY